MPLKKYFAHQVAPHSGGQMFYSKSVHLIISKDAVTLITEMRA